MNGLLQRIIAAARVRAAALELPAVGPARSPRGFAAALRGRSQLHVIAEFKRKSPAGGSFAAVSVTSAVRAYAAGGASALSVLTEPQWFGGSFADLAAAAAATSLPVLCKDFVVAATQVHAAAAAGASAVLLIVRCLPGGQLGELVAAAGEAGLAVLLECHDERQLERALSFGIAVIGINNRDLDSLQVDRSVVRRLLPRVPLDRVVVAESGYETPEQLRELRGCCDAALVGTALLRARDPAAFLSAVQP
ncbi:MAG TPA: indole-3-glycerol-phosphate synthase [Planctomycetota bacterium]|nr:indole-3-glycerol-phosphate synthase [Planctomycetota bacterium]